MVSDIKVRFAPSPTGELHIGGARTALFNYLFAKKENGKFILRIDDTDLERSREEYLEKLLESMRWLGLQWDEGPIYQSKRLDLYTGEVERLLASGKAYHCYCSVEELAEERETARQENKTYLYPGRCRALTEEQICKYSDEGRQPVIRLVTPDMGKTIVRDEIRGEVSFENADLDDFIIMKSNGLPTYNFASVVDDVNMGITHIIRAEEHLPNTPRQIICMEALGYDVPIFAHVPMILAADRSKLSKRHGATSVEEFRRDGFLPEAMVNYMALLGWSPGGDEEIFDINNIAEKFSLERVNNTAAVYDTTKLTWINSHYLREYNLDILEDLARPYFEECGYFSGRQTGENREFYRQVLSLVRERAKTLADLAEASLYFYSDTFDYDSKGVEKHFKGEGTAELLKEIAAGLADLESYTRESLEKYYHHLSAEKEIGLGKLIHPTRLAITGQTVGPGFFELLESLGSQRVINRLHKAADLISSKSV